MNRKIKHMVYCALCASILSILAQIKIDLPGVVPITLQTLGIYFIMAILSPRMAALTVLLYIGLGAIGLPVFAGFQGGFSILVGATGGFIFSFPIATYIGGILYHAKSKLTYQIVSMIVATCIIYGLGVGWYMYVMQTGWVMAVTWCVLPFVWGDILKIIMAIVLSKKIKNRIKI